MNIDTILHPNAPTPAQKLAAFNACVSVAESIRELKSVPAGHLYASICDKLDLASFEAIVATLARAGLVVVAEVTRELKWIGPKIR